VSAPDKPRRLSRRIRTTLWSAAGFFVLGYFPTILLRNPVPSIALAACLVIPYGSRSPTVRVGAVRGALLGAVTGLAVTAAIAAILIQVPPRAATQPASSAPATRPAATRPADGRDAQIDLAAIGSRVISGTAILCASAAALFAYLAARRRQRIEDEWAA